MSWPHLNPPDQALAEPIVEPVNRSLNYLPISCPPLPKADLAHRGRDQVEGLKLHHRDWSQEAGSAEKAEQRRQQLIGGGQWGGWRNLSPPDLLVSRGGAPGSVLP